MLSVVIVGVIFVVLFALGWRSDGPVSGLVISLLGGGVSAALLFGTVGGIIMLNSDPVPTGDVMDVVHGDDGEVVTLMDDTYYINTDVNGLVVTQTYDRDDLSLDVDANKQTGVYKYVLPSNLFAPYTGDVSYVLVLNSGDEVKVR